MEREGEEEGEVGRESVYPHGKRERGGAPNERERESVCVNFWRKAVNA